MTDNFYGSSRSNGRWTKQEHEKFLLGLQLYGKNWKKIEEVVGTRNGSQIRSHAQKFFFKVKKTIESAEQDEPSNENHNSNDTSTVISKQNSQMKGQNSHFSYFFTEIIKASNSQQSFNFWNHFIDQKNNISHQESSTKQGDAKRKNSFIGFDLTENTPLMELSNIS